MNMPTADEREMGRSRRTRPPINKEATVTVSDMTDHTEILDENEIQECRVEADELATIEANGAGEEAETEWIDQELEEARRNLMEEPRSPGGAYQEAYSERYEEAFKVEFEKMLAAARENKLNPVTA